MQQDLVELRDQRREDHHRLRSAEGAVALMVEAQKEARRGEAVQYRRLEIKLQWLALAVTFAGVLVTAVTVFVHH